ncbi:hypothetical protein [Oceanobacillus bengalensis]|uniref:Lipoprotein n=1 Tax=Oceanobacillus bengalensis TaxID=1435466 RepID=A0A494Z065_9BACI|nr:hypothetical protein [Oceanobacillus bengalensis]RKQ15882.1 hypothetical protein D8M05_08985 [Oceanobacillus bengalensis]
MRKFLILLLLFIIVLSGCNQDTGKGKKNSSGSNSETSEEKFEPIGQEEHEGQWYSVGRFYSIEQATNIEKIKVGPITLHIELAELIRGNYYDENIMESYDQGIIEYEDEEQEFVNLLVKFTTTDSIENLTFDNNHISLATNMDDQFKKPDKNLSSLILAGYMEGNNSTFSFVFPIKESKIEEIESIKVHVKAPIDQNGNSVGEDAEIEFQI